jgi:biotin transporter BioY
MYDEMLKWIKELFPIFLFILSSFLISWGLKKIKKKPFKEKSFIEISEIVVFFMGGLMIFIIHICFFIKKFFNI